MEYFTTGESLKAVDGAGRRTRPRTTIAARMVRRRDRAQDRRDRRRATTLRFDASDLMPGEVGSGSFWKGMTSYISGTTDLDTALKEIDDSWPKK